MSLLKITHLQCRPQHQLALTFSDGREGRVDFASVIRNELPAVFLPLLDDSKFQQAHLVNGTTAWPGDLDLAPEFLYFCSFRNEPDLQPRFEAWGYIETSEQPTPAHA
jgi:hypothetical protein